MSTTTDGANLDATTFDVDAWIDAKVRPEVTVSLYPNDEDIAARAKAIEDQIPLAEKTKPENRGLDDPSVEALAAQLQDLRTEREASAVKVRIRQLTQKEFAAATLEGVAAGVTDAAELAMWSIAAACVEPAFTPDQLLRLYTRDVSGEQMVNQLADAANGLRQGVPVPFSPAPSGGSRTS